MSVAAIDEANTTIPEHQSRPQSRSESPEDEPRTPPHSPLRNAGGAQQSDEPQPTKAPATPMPKDSFVMKANPKAASPRHDDRGFYSPPPQQQQRGRSESKSGKAGPAKPAAPEGPPLPAEVAKLSKMSARDRVKEGLRIMRSLQPTRASGIFRSATERDPYNLHQHPNKTSQQLRKEAMEEEWRQSVASRSGSIQSSRGRSEERKPGDVPRGSAARSSSWARDTTARGNFMYNWTAMPQVVPKKYIDPTPGPGQYTPVLHFLGGSH